MITVTELRSWDDAFTPDLRCLMKELTGRDDTPSDRFRALVESPSTHLYAAMEDGRIVGCATLCPYESPTGRKGAIEDVVVLSSCRGQGLGRRLMEHLLSEAQALSPIELHLTSRPSRTAANALYARLGFTRRETNSYCLSL